MKHHLTLAFFLLTTSCTQSSLDKVDAMTALYQAADSGDIEVQYHLGKHLCCGNDPEHNNAMGFAYMCESAKQGHAKAQYQLGLWYEHGIDLIASDDATQATSFLLPKDPSKAYMWQSIAAKGGYKPAKRKRKKLAKSLSIDTINEAIAARKHWRATVCR